MRLFLLFLLLLVSARSFSQTRSVSGSVVDSTGNILTDVSVNLKSALENLSVKTNNSGKYRFANVASNEFVISITSVGFESYTQAFIVNNRQGKAFIIDPVKLKLKTNELPEIIVMSNPVTIKEDTIEYRADAFKVREGAPVEDVLKKLPGITVDKDGVVTAQGKEVNRVRVNGKDYFGGDVITATQNLPANIVENIQIIDDYGDKANLTGIKEGNPEKVLNINIQKGKNRGSFGNVTAAAGTEGRYLGKISANNFKEERQLSFLGSLNNTNANTFNFNGDGRGGGARSVSFGSIERGGGGDGITYSTSLGLNYRDTWSKQLTSYGSYSYSGRKNNTLGTSFQQDFNPRDINSIRRVNESKNNSYNHRITWNLEYKMDSLNYLKVTPFLSFASSENSNNGISEYRKPKFYTLNNGNSRNAAATPGWGTDLFYILKFKKRGRNLNIQGAINYSAYEQERNVINDYYNVDSTFFIPEVTHRGQNQFIDNNNGNTTTNFRFSFSEPIAKYTSLEASYIWNNIISNNIRTVDDINAITGEKLRNLMQSNDYSYQFTTNRFGLNMHIHKKKYNYLLGIIAQPSVLTGLDKGRNTRTENRNFNIAPIARFSHNISRGQSIVASYNGTSREPNFTQLQPVTDSSNIKNIISGNPNLKAEFTNRLRLQYNKVGILSGASFFTNLSFDETKNKIVSSRVNEVNGTGRTTTYLNTNGFYGFNGNMSISQPFANRKLTASINTSASYDNNISYTDNNKNTGNNWILSPGAGLRIDFPDIIDVNIFGSYTYNKNTSRYPTFIYSSLVKTLSYGLDGKNYFLKDWTFGYELMKIINSGYINTINANTTLLNLYIERRFFKNNKGFLRIQGYDLFNQNTAITRNINGTTVSDVQNNRLGRYFLLSFNFGLQKFAGKQHQHISEEKKSN